MVDGRAPFPEDPLTRMMIRPQMERFADVAISKAKTDNSPRAQAAAKRMAEIARVPDLEAVLSGLTPEQQNTIKNGTQLEKAALLEKLPPATQIDILGAWKQPQRQGLFPLASPTLRRRISIMNGAQQIITPI